MIEYKVLEGWDWIIEVAKRELEDAVAFHLADGWQLCGGVSVTGVTSADGKGMSKVIYAQAMTRLPEVKP